MSDFVRPRTAQAAVLDELRARILRGDIAPGGSLRQEDLAASLGVSRVPVREALRMLEAEGHVAYTAHRGYRVVEVSRADLEEIYHLRAVLEDDLAILAVADTRGTDLARVRDAFAELAAAEAALHAPGAPGVAPQSALAAANRAFHWAVLRPGPRSDRILTTLWDSSDVYRARWFADPENIARGSQDHRAILAAVEQRDAGALIAASSAHRARAIAALLPLLPDPAAPDPVDGGAPVPRGGPAGSARRGPGRLGESRGPQGPREQRSR